MQKLALFLNGEKPLFLDKLKDYEKLYCTDGAFHFLEENGITPDLIIGDFDSIKKLPEHIPNIHTPDQEFTDFEKALQIIVKQGFSAVDVFAANGMEQDHFLGNLTTALNFKDSLEIVFYDDKQSYFFIKKQFSVSGVLGKTVSLFPFPKTKKVFSTGLEYPLNGMNLSMKRNIIGNRNKAIENTIEISFSKGNLLVFIEN